MHHDERTRRVRAAELERHARRGGTRAATELFAVAQNRRHRALPVGRRHPDVDKAAERVRGREQVADPGLALEHACDELDRQLLRRAARALRQLQRDVRSEVAELGIARRFEDDRRRSFARDESGCGAFECGGDLLQIVARVDVNGGRAHYA